MGGTLQLELGTALAGERKGLEDPGLCLDPGSEAGASSAICWDVTRCRCLDKLTAHKQEFFSFLRARWIARFDIGFEGAPAARTSASSATVETSAAIACRW